MGKKLKICEEMHGEMRDEILHVVNGCMGLWIDEKLINETRGKLNAIKERYARRDPAINEMAFVPVQYKDPLFAPKRIQVFLVHRENTVGRCFWESGTETCWECVDFNPETEIMTFRGVGDGADGYTQVLSAREFFEQYKWEDIKGGNDGYKNCKF